LISPFENEVTMKVLPLPPAHLRPQGRPDDPLPAAAVVALTALITLALTQNVSDVAVVVSPVLVALGLQR